MLRLPAKLHFIKTCGVLILGISASNQALHALIVTAHDSDVHDRFSSGFPLSPVANTDPSFVAKGVPISGIAWSTTSFASNTHKNLAMLSPQHFLTAQHYEYNSFNNQDTKGVRVIGQDGFLHTSEGVTSMNNLGYGLNLTITAMTEKDLAIGALQKRVTNPSNINRVAILDLNNSSSNNDYSNYNGLLVTLHGHGGAQMPTASPRLANTPITNLANNGGDTTQPVLVTSQTDAKLETGDSASPALHIWTNPEGSQGITVLGVNSSISATQNFISFLPVAGALDNAENILEPEGYALNIVGDPDNTWVGSTSIEIEKNSAWGLGGNPNSTGATSDRFVLFDPAQASSSSITVDSNYNLRGIYFKSSGASDAFTFAGSGTLTIGRGGLTNYDADQQIFTADLALDISQYWNGGAGGFSLADLDTNGHLLELQTTGDSTISGNISDSGSLALSEGTLTLSGNSTYTGNTWVHEGDLRITGDISSSASLKVEAFGIVSGSGKVPSVSGDGHISPGSSPGILTSHSVNPTGGLNFDFEFTAVSAPTFNTPTASINDLLRLTSATPFTAALDSGNTISIYLNVGSVLTGQQFLGGFFTDENVDFLSDVSSANIEYYIADGGGPISFGGQNYSLYDGPLLFNLTTELQTANFGAGNVNGRILTITTSPDVTCYDGWVIFHNLTGPDAATDADTDFDRVDQLHEFAFGGDPDVAESGLLPFLQITEDGGSDYLELSMTRIIGLQGIDYIPQTTTNVNSWPVDSTGIEDDTPTPVDNLDGTETLIYRRSQAVSAVDKAFIRVDVSEAP